MHQGLHTNPQSLDALLVDLQPHPHGLDSVPAVSVTTSSPLGRPPHLARPNGRLHDGRSAVQTPRLCKRYVLGANRSPRPSSSQGDRLVRPARDLKVFGAQFPSCLVHLLIPHICSWATCGKSVLNHSLCALVSFLALALSRSFYSLSDGPAVVSLCLVPSCPTPGCSPFRSLPHPPINQDESTVSWT